DALVFENPGARELVVLRPLEATDGVGIEGEHRRKHNTLVLLSHRPGCGKVANELRAASATTRSGSPSDRRPPRSGSRSSAVRSLARLLPASPNARAR